MGIHDGLNRMLGKKTHESKETPRQEFNEHFGPRKDLTGRNNIKGLIGTGIGGMAGLGAIGSMNSIPGMPANNIGSTVGAGVSLANLGNVARIGMNIIPRNKIYRDHKSHNRECPNCKGNAILIGHNKLRGEDLYSCLNCKQKHKVDV